MKFATKSLLMVMVLVLVGSTAMADYANPPGWENETDFTHQSWEFNTGATNGPPDGDPAWVNPCGTPNMTDVYLADPGMMEWSDVPMGITTDRRGMWGGMTFNVAVGEVSISMTFDIPNYQRPAPWKKQIWVEMTYFGTDGHAFVEVEGYGSEVISSETFELLPETPGSSSQWWRYTALIDLPDQPASETITVGLIKGTEMAVMIDEIDIDTRCVPGPATTALLGLGGIGALLRRKRRA